MLGEGQTHIPSKIRTKILSPIPTRIRTPSLLLLRLTSAETDFITAKKHTKVNGNLSPQFGLHMKRTQSFQAERESKFNRNGPVPWGNASCDITDSPL